MTSANTRRLRVIDTGLQSARWNIAVTAALTERQLAAIPIAHRDFASRTPGAQKADLLDFDGYLASPMIAEPLRNLDCCLITDGAAGYVMTTLERARDLRHKPAVMAGVACASLPVTLAEMFTQNRDFLQFAASMSSRQAYRMAGITAKGPACFDAEMYIAAAPAEFAG